MQFRIGQTTGVREFVSEQVQDLGRRLGLCHRGTATLGETFLRALEANERCIETNLMAPMVEPVPESRCLFDLIGEHAVSAASKLMGLHHMVEALDFMAAGGNILVVQNHTSGADTLAWDVLVNRAFDDRPATQFGYLAGHVVNLFLVPLAITAAVRRFQIFSTKYMTDGVPGMDGEIMKRANGAALMALGEFVGNGGKCVVLYPEGGRGEGALKQGDPRTVKIGEVMAEMSPRGLMVLPTYVEGATSILPVVRTPDEFCLFIRYAQAGTASVTCGRPIPWNELTNGVSGDSVERKVETHARTMRAIAALAPTAEARGPWL